MNRTITPESIAIYPHLYAFDLLLRELRDNNEVEKILVYFLDMVPEAALPAIAEGFDLLGVKGWERAITVEDQRELLKNAIRLKRLMGTPWAVEEAMRISGYDDFELIEGSGGHWAKSRFNINISTHYPDPEQVRKALRIVEVYKRKSIHIEGLYFGGLDVTDELIIDDSELSVNAGLDNDEIIRTGGGLLYNGSVSYDGDRNYSQESDTVTIEFFT